MYFRLNGSFMATCTVLKYYSFSHRRKTVFKYIKKGNKLDTVMTLCCAVFIFWDKTQDRGVQRTAAGPHSSASRNLGMEANSQTGVTIHAGGGGTAAIWSTRSRTNQCVRRDVGEKSGIVADSVCDLSETVSKPSPSTHSWMSWSSPFQMPTRSG